jgi:uncharacterized protein (DUF169 family)
LNNIVPNNLKGVFYMESKIAQALRLKNSPVAVILTNDKPGSGLKFKEGSWGCVASMLLSASKGRLAYFDRKTFGCPGGGTGLGFGNQYKNFPIECLLSTGNKEFAAKMGRKSAMEEGERFYRTPELARKFVSSLPITDIPYDYVVFKPLEETLDEENPRLVMFLVNPDQLSALVALTGYDRGGSENVIAPFGASCQSIIFGYAEAEKENPRGIIGFLDIAQRNKVDRETLSFTVPYKMFQEMEANVEGSFLEMEDWRRLQERQ